MRVVFLFILVFFSIVVYGQVDADSLPVDQDSVIVGNDEKLHNDVVEFSKKENLLSRLLRNIVRDDTKKNGSNEWDYSYLNYERFEGKAINKIEIISSGVFGNGENGEEKLNFLARAGNALHVSTRPWIVRYQLLFKEGETVSPFIIAESERLLRNKPYIYSAEISIREDELHADSVNVQVVVKDVWSILPDGSFDFSNGRGFLKFQDINFMGHGATFFGAIKKRHSYGREWSIDAGLQLDNLFHQHLNARIFKESGEFGRTYGFSVERNFISPTFNWAGGIDISWSDHYIKEIENDSFKILNEKFHLQEYWLGYATDFSKISKRDHLQNEFYLAAGFKKTRFLKTPEVIHDYWGNNYLALASIGYAFRRYQKARYVRYLGRLEDIPTGSILSATFGKRFVDEGLSRPYAGLKAGFSIYKNRFGYFSTIIESGSYFHHGKSELGAIKVNLIYFTPLVRTGNLSVRNFFSLRGGYLHNPYLFDHLINLEHKEDIRGFPTVQTGNRRFTLNYEINLYPPIKIFGFNFALIGFADLAWVVPDHARIWKSRFFQGFGGGFRIRNELLVFRSVQILFGYYPNGTDNRLRFFEEPQRFYDLEFIEFMKPHAVIE